jgi:hypothetical protein
MKNINFTRTDANLFVDVVKDEMNENLMLSDKKLPLSLSFS